MENKKSRKPFAKRMILPAIVAAILAVALISFLLYGRRQKNIIAPFAQDSPEMTTAQLFAGPDGAFLFHYTVDSTYKQMTLFLTKYEGEAVIDRTEATSMDLTGDSDDTGVLGFVPDFRTYTVNAVSSSGGSKVSFQTSILEDVEDREHYGRGASAIQNEMKISDGKEIPLLALSYGKTDVEIVQAEDLADGVTPAADYTYLYSAVFSK